MTTTLSRCCTVAAGFLILSHCVTAATAAAAAAAGLERIDNIVVIYAENHSFDNMYGTFPGANGVANATAEQKTQVDHDGNPLPHLPPVYTSKGEIDPRFPRDLPNGPFRIDAPPVNASLGQIVPSPVHSHYENIEQINGGRNNRFVAMSDKGAWTMGYYDGSKTRMWQWAREYTLSDNYFMGAFGGSFLNHQWLICACTPVYRDATPEMRAQLDEHGRLKKKPDSPASVLDGPVRVWSGTVSPDGYAINTAQPPYQPSQVQPAKDGNSDLTDPAKHALPPQTAKTIGDTLSAKGISWAWYAGAWNAALADGRQAPDAPRTVIYSKEADSPNFQPHHQPFNYYAHFAPGTAARARHLKDAEEMFKAIDAGTLPQVSFYKPPGRLTQHPAYTTIEAGDLHIAELLERLRKSPQWKHMAVIVTYDENGGYWDHVPPPSGPGWGDRWGPGTRIPLIVVSPFARHGYVDHTTMDTTSIIKFITRRFGLEPLPGVRTNMGDMTSAFDFSRD